MVGDSGVIFKTINGGKDWITLQSSTNKNLKSIHFISPRQGFVIGEHALLLKTTDRGATWKQMGSNCSLISAPEGTTFTLSKVYFSKSNMIY